MQNVRGIIDGSVRVCGVIEPSDNDPIEDNIEDGKVFGIDNGRGLDSTKIC